MKINCRVAFYQFLTADLAHKDMKFTQYSRPYTRWPQLLRCRKSFAIAFEDVIHNILFFAYMSTF